MIKFLLILFIGLVFESVGLVFLKKGITQLGEIKQVSVSEVARIVKAGVTNRYILLGTFFEAMFFGGLLFLLSKCDVSFLWPMTALSFVFSTFAAMIFLGERVSSVRWAGVVLIVLGAACITWSEKMNEKRAEEPKATAAIASQSQQ